VSASPTDLSFEFVSTALTQLQKAQNEKCRHWRHMTENGDPYENALAERVNGIIKTEFNLHSGQLGFEQTYNQIKRSIKVYNEIRPHSSCDYLTPNQAHLQSENLKKRWKNYNKKFNYEKTAV
jgi:putative transposase